MMKFLLLAAVSDAFPSSQLPTPYADEPGSVELKEEEEEEEEEEEVEEEKKDEDLPAAPPGGEPEKEEDGKEVGMLGNCSTLPECTWSTQPSIHFERGFLEE
ncbi:unnamed protein product [Cylicocyclus nassatus]|uniref:Uncharacterized protein n=1 Tax=Cylicocyclus nassatus TaxID=53992 RepID=A0AA36H473_CYLNA|nr:unnamed protein product [Cylicocyclus nassatus]